MQRAADKKEKNTESVSNIEDQRLSTPYESPFGGYSYYPTMLFKRRASSVPPLSSENSFNKTSSLQGVEESVNNNEHRNSRDRLNVQKQRAHSSTITPLLRRYRPNESKEYKYDNEQKIDKSIADNRGSSNSLRLTSPLQQKRFSSSKVTTSLPEVTKRNPKQKNISKTDIPNENVDLNQKGLNKKKRVTISCPPVLQRSEINDRRKLIEEDEKNKKHININTTPICPEKHCIHSRQSILNYIDLQRELRECYNAINDRDNEIKELRSQIHLIQKEKSDLQSYFEMEIKKIEKKYSEKLVKESEDQIEWQQHLLSEQLEYFQKEREDIEKIKYELEQERRNHAQTQSELNSTYNMCTFLKEELQRLQDSPNTLIMKSTRESSLLKGQREQFSPEIESPASILTTPTPRRQPPPVPQPIENEENKTRTDILNLSPVRDKLMISPSKFYNKNNIEQCITETTAMNSTINISDPSIAPSALFDLDSVGEGLLLDQNKRGEPHTRIKREIIERCDEGTQCGIEEWIEINSKTLNLDDKKNKQNSLNKRVLNSSLIYGKSVFGEQSDVVDNHRSQVHPFEHLSGQEALLCKELLRALLDKEKQLAELTSEQIILKEKEKQTLLSK